MILSNSIPILNKMRYSFKSSIISKFCYRNMQSLINQLHIQSNIQNLNLHAIPVTQGGNIILNLQSLSYCKILITTFWQDHCELYGRAEIPIHLKAEINQITNSCNITTTDEHLMKSVTLNSEEVVIKLVIPEICNVSVMANHVNFILKNKMMGDLIVIVKEGDVTIDKVRGENINIKNDQGDIKIVKLLEATKAVIQSRSLMAKMINGEFVDINTNDNISIEAMYAKLSNLSSVCGGVLVDHMKGKLFAKAEVGDISINGIDGSFEVLALKGRVELQINKLFNNCLSKAISINKNVRTRIDPELKVEIECEAIGSSARNSIDIISDNFQCTYTSETKSIIRGYLSSLVNESETCPSLQSGKININESAIQSLENKDISITPKLLLQAGGHIRVETVSWLQAISMKHGLSYENNHTKIGRTAKASQRTKDLLQLKEIQEKRNENDHYQS